ncbi:MAG: HigA family addiction module antitoxin [Tepidiformaceae bacterium]
MATEGYRYSDLAIHPGAFLAEEIDARGITQQELASQMHRTLPAVRELLRGRRRITAETALTLETALGLDAKYWMDLQSVYDLTVARITAQARAS